MSRTVFTSRGSSPIAGAKTRSLTQRPGNLAAPTLPGLHSGCTVHRAHSRGICGRRVEYVPGYVGREYRRRYSPRETSRRLSACACERMTSFPPRLSLRSLARGRRHDFASTSRMHARRGCNVKYRLSYASERDRSHRARKRFRGSGMQLRLKMFSPEIDTFADANSYSSCDALMT